MATSYDQYVNSAMSKGGTQPSSPFQAPNITEWFRNLFGQRPLPKPNQADADMWSAQMGGYAPAGTMDYAGNPSNLTPSLSDLYANVPRNPGRSNQPRKLPIADYVTKHAPAPEPELPEIPRFNFGEAPGGYSWDPYDKSIKDFLPESRELYAAAIEAAMNDIAGREKNLKRQGKQSNRALKQMFGDYVENTEARAPEISERYDEASTSARTQADAAAQSSQQAYNESLQQQAAIRRSLGMEDVDLRDAETQQADIMQQAVADANTRAQTQQTQLGSNEQAQLDWNESVASAGAAEGLSQRSLVQRDLLSHLASLQDQRTITQADYENKIVGSAFDLFNMDYGQYNNDRNAGIASAQDAYSRWAAEQGMAFDAFNQQRQYELSLSDRAEDTRRYEEQAMAEQQQMPEFDLNKQRIDAQMQHLFQMNGFNPQQANTAIDVFQSSLMNGGGDRDQTRFMRTVQQQLQRLGWDENQIRVALIRGSEYWKNYTGS